MLVTAEPSPHLTLPMHTSLSYPPSSRLLSLDGLPVLLLFQQTLLGLSPGSHLSSRKSVSASDCVPGAENSSLCLEASALFCPSALPAGGWEAVWFRASCLRVPARVAGTPLSYCFSFSKKCKLLKVICICHVLPHSLSQA